MLVFTQIVVIVARWGFATQSSNTLQSVETASSADTMDSVRVVFSVVVGTCGELQRTRLALYSIREKSFLPRVFVIAVREMGSHWMCLALKSPTRRCFPLGNLMLSALGSAS